MSALRKLSGLESQSPCKPGYEGAERTRTAVTVVQSENEGKSSDAFRWDPSCPKHGRSMWHGFPLAFAVTALTAAIIPFGYWAALGLLVLIVLTPAVGRR